MPVDPGVDAVTDHPSCAGAPAEALLDYGSFAPLGIGWIFLFGAQPLMRMAQFSRQITVGRRHKDSPPPTCLRGAKMIEAEDGR